MMPGNNRKPSYVPRGNQLVLVVMGDSGNPLVFPPGGGKNHCFYWPDGLEYYIFSPRWGHPASERSRRKRKRAGIVYFTIDKL
jgi:hypothetical protein